MLKLILLLVLTQPEVNGTVIEVGDGDTVKILLENGKEQKVRLSGIDAPEKDQAAGAASRKALEGLIGGKEVSVRFTGHSFDRRVGHIYLGEMNVQHEMLRQGWAWHSPKFSSSREQEEMQCEARTESRGLWSDPHPIEPWIWRKRPKRQG